MGDLKNGDMVELTSGLVNNLYHGDRLKFITSDGDNALLSQTIIVPKHIFKKVKEFKMDYEISNRKKLHDYIKSSGHTSVALGEIIGNKWCFSNVTKKSRFEGRGDIDTQSLEYFKKLVDNCICNIEAIENTKDCNDDLVDDSMYKVESKKSNWMTLNKIAFGICLILVFLLISFLYLVVSK